MDGDQPFRFISWNIPNLHLIEDRLDFDATNAWRLPDRFEVTDALSTVRQMGGTVARTYAISVVRGNDPLVIGQQRHDGYRFGGADGQVIQTAALR